MYTIMSHVCNFTALIKDLYYRCLDFTGGMHLKIQIGRRELCISLVKLTVKKQRIL